MQRPTAPSRLSFHRTGSRCPTPVYVHDDDDDDTHIDIFTELHHQSKHSNVRERKHPERKKCSDPVCFRYCLRNVSRCSQKDATAGYALIF
jgi:hypothetical protein